MKKIDWQYTFGEILIVILGISIAFSINKCSDESTAKATQKQYLTYLKNDIEGDKLILEDNLNAISANVELIKEILPKLNSNAADKMTVVGKIFKIVEINNFNPNDVTYQTMINSGDFKLIKDFKLKTAIEKHYSNYKIMLQAYRRQENIQKEYVGDYFIYETDYEAFQKGNFGFTDEKLLKNIIQSMNGSYLIKIEAIKKGIASCDSLIAILNKSL